MTYYTECKECKFDNDAVILCDKCEKEYKDFEQQSYDMAMTTIIAVCVFCQVEKYIFEGEHFNTAATAHDNTELFACKPCVKTILMHEYMRQFCTTKHT